MDIKKLKDILSNLCYRINYNYLSLPQSKKNIEQACRKIMKVIEDCIPKEEAKYINSPMKKSFKCVYCDKPIKYEGTCKRCGHKEDVALGKIEDIT